MVSSMLRLGARHGALVPIPPATAPNAIGAHRTYIPFGNGVSSLPKGHPKSIFGSARLGLPPRCSVRRGGVRAGGRRGTSLDEQRPPTVVVVMSVGGTCPTWSYEGPLTYAATAGTLNSLMEEGNTSSAQVNSLPTTTASCRSTTPQRRRRIGLARSVFRAAGVRTSATPPSTPSLKEGESSTWHRQWTISQLRRCPTW